MRVRAGVVTLSDEEGPPTVAVVVMATSGPHSLQLPFESAPARLGCGGDSLGANRHRKPAESHPRPSSLGLRPELRQPRPRHNSVMKRKSVVLFLSGAVLAILVLRLTGGDSETEVERLARVLDLQPGDAVADVGAGDGWLSIEMAAIVGESGRVFATELAADRRDAIRAAVVATGLDNVTVVEAGERETNLAPECCDAIFLRRVYHHLTDTAATNASLQAALKPDGRLAIIELEFNGLLRPLRDGRTGPTTRRSSPRSPRPG